MVKEGVGSREWGVGKAPGLKTGDLIVLPCVSGYASPHNFLFMIPCLQTGALNQQSV